jgi:hypothetical protein
MEDEIKHQKIIEMPEPLGLFAGQLFDRGSEYLAAFRLLSKHEDEMMHAKYFLLAHSFELLLKSFLAASGITKAELKHPKKFGHDLDKIFAGCRRLSLPHIENLEFFVREIAEKNSDYDFRYPSNYNLYLPSPKLCLELMDPLEAVLRPIISQVRVSAQLKWAEETMHLKPAKIRWSD